MPGRLKKYFILLITVFSFLNCTRKSEKQSADQSAKADTLKIDTISYPQETHLKNIRQLTYQGENAEAYFSSDNTMLVFQRRNKNEGMLCDQIFYGMIPSENNTFTYNMLSNGKGRTTCSFFLPGDTTIIFASTSPQVDTCMQDPDRSKGYLWGVYPGYEIYVADVKGNILKQLTNNNFYDAEDVVSPKGDKILFTSNRSGDLELWTMNMDGSNPKQITNELGYDGGAFYNNDGSKIIFRASRPKTKEEIKEYKDLLKQNYVKPTSMELFMCDADGSNLKQITNLGGANWAPYFTPDGKKIIFSSNYKTKRIPFNLYLINTDGSGLEQITYDKIFDSFPMFSSDGKKLVFASNRNDRGTRETNLFIADWNEER